MEYYSRIKRWFKEPRSIATRQLFAAVGGLFLFCLFVGLSLDHTFRVTAERDLNEKLRGYAYAFAGQSEIGRSGNIIPPFDDRLPDSEFNRPGSGLYARIVTKDSLWDSPSSRGPILPSPTVLQPGKEAFDGPLPFEQIDGESGQLYQYSYGLTATLENSIDVPYTVQILQDAEVLNARVHQFRQTLWRTLGFASLALALFQMVLVFWSLRPLKKVISELDEVKSGKTSEMTDGHPTEILPLTESINAFIESERNNLDRQRNSLSDLAHSLKTPIAVMRTLLENEAPPEELRPELATQLNRMNEQVSYQLARAASGGHKLFSAPLEIEPVANDIVTGLEKIYARNGVLAEFDIDRSARFYGEVGDLHEILGNLLENAFKWARHSVLLTVKVGDRKLNRRAGLIIAIDDDGPGVPEEKVPLILQRGVRGDQLVKGHGIGLAIVQEIIKSYRGTLEVSKSRELGGARFEVRLPSGLT